jgi:hypothetical protein
MAWQVFVWGMKIAKSGEVSETLKIMFHPIIFGVSFGFIVFSLTLLIDFLKTLQDKEE